MATIRRYPHLFIDLSAYQIPFAAPTGRGGDEHPPPVKSRPQHYQRFAQTFESAVATKRAALSQSANDSEDAQIHLSVTARSDIGVVAEVTKDAYQKPQGVLQLLSIKGRGRRQRANLLLTLSKADTLRNRAAAYAEWDGDGRRPANFFFFESIDRFFPTKLEDLWLDAPELLPEVGKVAEWEIWVKPEASQKLRNSARLFGVRFDQGEVEFSRVRVLRGHARREDLQRLIDGSGAVMELRACSSLTLDVLDMGHNARRELNAAIASRMRAPGADAARISILDTGVDHSHPMLSSALPESRCHSLAEQWPVNGWDPHGTLVAGIALYPKLANILDGRESIKPENGLESVTVLRPPNGQRFPREATGEIAAAVEVLEASEDAKRVYCLAFTSPTGSDDGTPSTLSASVDQLAWGKDAEPRLFCVAAGNILDEPLMMSGYVNRNEESGITCPGQALNALTVGGCTFVDEHPGGGDLLCAAGDLSPTSKTSWSWANKRAIKPDVVFEAGNHEVDRDTGETRLLQELGVLTTNKHPSRRFGILAETSAATAAISGMAGRLSTRYPQYWPETIRGLIVHSTDWTPAMLERTADANKQLQRDRLVALYGYGVPDEDRARQSASDALTLIAQDQFAPFSFENGRTVATQLAYHELPWPARILREMGKTQVELRVTLSYFIEPDLAAAAAGRWSRYASHRLGFDVRGPEDNELDVLMRRNRALRSRRTSSPPERSEDGWALGSQLRERGTIHHDRFSGAAVDVARQNGIRITPKKGWWTDDLWKGQYAGVPVRYSLIVSIRSPGITQDIYQAAVTEMASMSRQRNRTLIELAVRPTTSLRRK
ncbi:S8 family peptidase [Bradyrhizobium sp. Ec3.3]|uniref:S8 family peptidase n=1 Tax=Bradyrhizobium sp. Ec3.3 TaxID=189753 RepID=UPI000413511E|nr:S8 family peptidase [Bradyrhizobium sp. Ec3.3]